MLTGPVQAFARHACQKLLGKGDPLSKRVGATPGHDDYVGFLKGSPDCRVVARTDVLGQALKILGLDLGELVDHDQPPDICKLRQFFEEDNALHELDGLVCMLDAGVAGIHHDHAGGDVGGRRIFQRNVQPVAVLLAVFFGKVSRDRNFGDVVKAHSWLPG
jgi:hypothetical protein